MANATANTSSTPSLCTARIRWHHRMMDALHTAEATTRDRYQRDQVRIMALKELVTLHADGQLTAAKWEAITRRIHKHPYSIQE